MMMELLRFVVELGGNNYRWHQSHWQLAHTIRSILAIQCENGKRNRASDRQGTTPDVLNTPLVGLSPTMLLNCRWNSPRTCCISA
jgi:hypothetical protein